MADNLGTYIGISNSVSLAHMRAATINQEKLTDLLSRADSLKSTGAKLDNWHEFNRHDPSDFQPSIGGALFGLIGGGTIGAILTMFGAMLISGPGAPIAPVALIIGSAIGAAAGGISGYNYDAPESKRFRQIEKYGKYLDSVETSLAMGRGRSNDVVLNPHARDDFGDRYLQENKTGLGHGK